MINKVKKYCVHFNRKYDKLKTASSKKRKVALAFQEECE